MRKAHLMDEVLPRLQIDLPTLGFIDTHQLFPTAPTDVWLEVGFGGGEHLAAQAKEHPELGFIGCEPFVNGLVISNGLCTYNILAF